jgi:ribose transport system ATP-binding protein
MLELKHISKAFAGVRALNDVSVEFGPGEIHALIGENGAGKSTLIKILCGIYTPDEGQVFLDGQQVVFHSYGDAIEKKINLVSQEIQVIPKSSVAENIMLDKIERYFIRGRIDWKLLNQDAQKYIDMVELNLPPTLPVGNLSTAQKQLTMIARALSSNARIVVMDEPTSALTLHETDNLLNLLKKIKKEDVTILFVSHKLEEVLEIADKVTVLRDGSKVGTCDNIALCSDDLVKMMIGREARTSSLGCLDVDPQQVVLKAENISQWGKFDGLNFQLCKGEILGFYGLVGSGRTELAQILIGEDSRDEGQVWIKGQPAKIKSVADSIYKYGLGYVSENRKEKGLILNTSIKTNITITIWNKILNKIGAIKLKEEDNQAEHYIKALGIRTTDANQQVMRLSGGNQQKVSIAKWLAARCDILIFDEPTIGVDIGAKEYIHQLIWNLAKNEGKSIILISSDMPEIINVARRILVFKDFKIVGEIHNNLPEPRGYEEVSQEIGKYLA